MTQEEALTNPIDAHITEQIEVLARKLFGDMTNMDEPILGKADEDVVAPNIHSMITDPNNVVAEWSEGAKVVGFSVAVPIGKMDPSRTAESRDTAYIYFTGVEPERQGEGLVGKLMERMIGQLKARGYSFIERDCMVKNGYADSVEKAYTDAIVEQHDHTTWPEVGPERFFRIDLSKLAE